MLLAIIAGGFKSGSDNYAAATVAKNQARPDAVA
jgi:hypothetical protein